MQEEKKSCDYMSISYELNREPLYLRDESRAWFESVYLKHIGQQNTGAALLLGSVDWMISMLAKRQDKVFVLDSSAVMINRVKQQASAGVDKVSFVPADWTNLPALPTTVDTILGDNSFNYLKFPDEWQRVRDRLAAMMTVGGTAFFRFFAVPEGHRNLSPANIVDKYQSSDPINYTAVRTEILYSQWDAKNYRIETERALASYEANHAVFKKLLEDKPPGFRNDLETIVKYRGTGAVYHVPPLGEILKLLGEAFDVVHVDYGPYELSRYFPLVVVRKR